MIIVTHIMLIIVILLISTNNNSNNNVRERVDDVAQGAQRRVDLLRLRCTYINTLADDTFTYIYIYTHNVYS